MLFISSGCCIICVRQRMTIKTTHQKKTVKEEIMTFLKKIFPGLFICFLITTALYSLEVTPNQELVSNLLKKLENTKDGKERVDILNKFIQYLWGYDLEAAMDYAEQALELAQKISYHIGIVDANNNVGFIKFFQSDFEGSLAEYKKGLRKSYKSGYKNGFVAAYNGIGRYYQVKGTFDKALDKFLVSKDICEQIGNKSELAYCYYGLGAIHFYDQQVNYDEALKYFMKSLELREEINDKNGMTSSYYAIGEVFRNQGDHVTALEYFQKCLSLSKEIGNIYNQSNALEGIGDIHKNRKEYNRVPEYYEKSLKIFKTFNEGFQKAAMLIRLGAYNNEIGDYEGALGYLNEAFETAESIKVPVLIKGAAEELVKTYKGLRNEAKAGQYEKIYSNKKDFLKDNEMIKLKIFSDIEKEKKRKKFLQVSLSFGCFLLILLMILYRNFRIKQKALKSVEMLNEIGKVITSNLSERKIRDVVYEIVNRLMDADAFWIYKYDVRSKKLVIVGGKEKDVEEPDHSYELSETNRPAVICYSKQVEIWFNDFRKEYHKYIKAIEVPKIGVSFNSHLFLPLTIDGKNGKKEKKIGVITVQSPKKKAYTKYHLNILKNIAVYAAIALDNANAYKQLKKANELKSWLFEMAAHDLRNPLQIIMGFTEQLGKKLNRDSTASGYLNNVFRASEQMERLIAEILEDAAIEKGEIELKNDTINFSRLVESVSAAHLPIADNKRQKITIDCRKNCFIRGDKDRLQEIIENLISNAIKFSPKCKTIRVKVEKNESKVIFRVRDEGPGLTEEDKRKLFNRFQKLSARPTGGELAIGLGLAITKYLVELHNGCIRVESETGKGATFIVELLLYKSTKVGVPDAKEIRKINSYKKFNFQGGKL